MHIISIDKNKGYRSDYTTSVGMAEHGWTKSTILRFLGEPDKLAINPHYRSGPPMRLYLTARVLDAQASPEFFAWLSPRLEKSMAKRQNLDEQLNERYPDWADALPEGCFVLKRLKRFAKHEFKCSDKQRKEISELRDQVTGLLLSLGHHPPKKFASCAASKWREQNGVLQMNAIAPSTTEFALATSLLRWILQRRQSEQREAA